jgi:hypothetical protein
MGTTVFQPVGIKARANELFREARAGCPPETNSEEL